jgi:hypothetical protein
MFELSIPTGPFEDGHDSDCEDNIKNSDDVIENNEDDIENITNIGGDIHYIPIKPLRQTQPSIEGCF